jgi:transcriptional regulator with XRE-family HTH domain
VTTQANIDHGADVQALAGRIRDTRTRLDVTQAAVAADTGIPRTGLVDIEWGRRTVSALELVRIADALRVPVTRLLGVPAAACCASEGVLDGLTPDQQQVAFYAQFLRWQARHTETTQGAR